MGTFVPPPQCAKKETDEGGMVLYQLVSRSRSLICVLCPMVTPRHRPSHELPLPCFASGLSFKELSTFVRAHIGIPSGPGEIHSPMSQAAPSHLSINLFFYLEAKVETDQEEQH